MKRLVIAIILIALTALDCAAATTVVDAVRGYLKERFAAYGVDVVVDEVAVRGRPPAASDYDTIKIKTSTVSSSARVPLHLVFIKDGLVVKRLWAAARVRLFMDLVVAKRTLRMKEVITVRDIAVERRQIRELNGGFIKDPSEVVGMVVRRPLMGGRPIKRAYLQQPSVVRRGDAITVVATSGAIKVKTRATALEDGYVGGFIDVKTSTGKILHGRVTGDGRLIVRF